MEETVVVIIVAAGKGARFGKEKQFVSIKRKPIYYYSIERFSKIKEVKEIVLVVSKNKIKSCEKYINSKKLKKEIKIVKGGKNRTESVKEGLKNMLFSSLILIHDGVRPFIGKFLIKKIIEGTKKFGACIPAIKITDTLKIAEEGFVKKTLPRQNVLKVQTPQGFRKDIILKAYNLYDDDFLDDSSVVESIGRKVKIISGEVTNFKITFPEDYQLAKKIVRDF